MEEETISYADVGELQRGIREMRLNGWQFEEVQERHNSEFEATFVRAPPDSLDSDPADFDPAAMLPRR